MILARPMKMNFVMRLILLFEKVFKWDNSQTFFRIWFEKFVDSTIFVLSLTFRGLVRKVVEILLAFEPQQAW